MILTMVFAGRRAFTVYFMGSLLAASSALACSVTSSDLTAARGQSDALIALHAEAERDCSRPIVDEAARLAGVALFNAALQEKGATQLGLLEKAAGYSDDWRILAALGQVQLASGEAERAAHSLQAALISLQDNPPSQPPPEDAVRRLITMANNARSLAPVFVRSLKTRSADPGGIAARSVAGVEIEVVPFPIEFVFGTTEVTEQTKPAIADLAEILSTEGGNKIVLAGHTDPVGSDDANLALSVGRAEAVRDQLLQSGLAQNLEIEVAGCGEASPPEIDSPELYSEDEIHQIMRRVELVRSGNPCK